jgi:hypothetical protein
MPVWDSLENLGSKLDDRAVLGHESAGGSDLVEMGEHDRIHVSEHDPPRAQVRKPRLEHVPADMAGQFAGIGEAFDNEEIPSGEQVHADGLCGCADKRDAPVARDDAHRRCERSDVVDQVACGR